MNGPEHDRQSKQLIDEALDASAERLLAAVADRAHYIAHGTATSQMYLYEALGALAGMDVDGLYLLKRLADGGEKALAAAQDQGKPARDVIWSVAIQSTIIGWEIRDRQAKAAKEAEHATR